MANDTVKNVDHILSTNPTAVKVEQAGFSAVVFGIALAIVAIPVIMIAHILSAPNKGK